jgi:hypothetical protein
MVRRITSLIPWRSVSSRRSKNRLRQRIDRGVNGLLDGCAIGGSEFHLEGNGRVNTHRCLAAYILLCAMIERFKFNARDPDFDRLRIDQRHGLEGHVFNIDPFLGLVILPGDREIHGVD